MGERTPDESCVKHPWQDDIVDVAATANQDATVLHALHTAADQLSDHCSAHDRAPSANTCAASSTPSTMLWYPVHRQRFEATATRISSFVGDGLSCRNAYDDIMKPGVQKPH